MKKYYHYTIEERVQEIIDSGQINLAHKSVYSKKEKPVAWVSSNDQWENTATKVLSNNFGNTKIMSFEEQLKSFGCGRIVVKSEGFMTWAKLKHVAKMNSEVAFRLEKVGISNGANPSEWFGSMYPIQKDKWLSAEIYKNGKWVEIESFNK